MFPQIQSRLWLSSRTLLGLFTLLYYCLPAIQSNKDYPECYLGSNSVLGQEPGMNPHYPTHYITSCLFGYRSHTCTPFARIQREIKYMLCESSSNGLCQWDLSWQRWKCKGVGRALQAGGKIWAKPRGMTVHGIFRKDMRFWKWWHGYIASQGMTPGFLFELVLYQPFHSTVNKYIVVACPLGVRHCFEC